MANRNYWIDNLRSFITVLVLAHHAALAYTTFSWFDKITYINSTHPVVDNSRWIGLDVFASFNDSFFMSLMFMISGLFIISGIRKKGSVQFLLGRAKRLGLPFLFAELFIIPAAYIPSYYLVNHQFNFGSFITDYLVHQRWPVGPPWFIWLLLAFNCLAAMLPQVFYIKAAELVIRLSRKPHRFVLLWFSIVAIAYIPLSLLIGQYKWTGFGPFDFQLNRVIFYFVFFLFGAILGTIPWEDYLFQKQLLLGKTTFFWIVGSILSYGSIELINYWGYGELAARQVPVLWVNLVFEVIFVSCSVITCFALMIIFRSVENKTSAAWKSLSANAYGMYLIHYVFVTWLQFALLGCSLPVIFKFAIVFAVTLALSWWVTNLLRKSRFISNLL